jgi:hypothetical protein
MHATPKVGLRIITTQIPVFLPISSWMYICLRILLIRATSLYDDMAELPRNKSSITVYNQHFNATGDLEYGITYHSIMQHSAYRSVLTQE